jgi:anti-sigma factor RsiW
MNRQHLSVDELADAAEGLLNSERAAFAESHIAGCPDCQAQSEALREVTASLRAEPVPPMPREVFRRLNDVTCPREVTDRHITGLTPSTVGRRPALLI